MTKQGENSLGSARSPCGGGTGLGRDRLRADPIARWPGRACGRAHARLGAKAAGGQWLGEVARGAPGTLRLGRPKTRAYEHEVTTACGPWRTDSDGAKLTACVVGVLTARAGALTCD